MKVQIPIFFSLEYFYYWDCIVIVKTFNELPGGTMALIFMAGCSYWLCKTKTKHNSLSGNQGPHHCWSSTVVYRGCGNVDSNSKLRLRHAWDIGDMSLGCIVWNVIIATSNHVRQYGSWNSRGTHQLRPCWYVAQLMLHKYISIYLHHRCVSWKRCLALLFGFKYHCKSHKILWSKIDFFWFCS